MFVVLKATWETQIEFQASGFSLASLWLLWAFGQRTFTFQIKVKEKYIFSHNEVPTGVSGTQISIQLPDNAPEKQ